MMRKGGGEELVAASKQFLRSRGEKSTRLGLVTLVGLTVGLDHICMRASKERASEGSVCGRNRCSMQSVPKIARERRALGSVWWG